MGGETEQVQSNYLDLSAKKQVKLVEEYWTVVKRVEPRYPVSAAKKNISGCVDLILGIDQKQKTISSRGIPGFLGLLGFFPF